MCVCLICMRVYIYIYIYTSQVLLIVEYIVLFHYLGNKTALKLYYFVLYFALAVYIFNRLQYH